MSAHRLPRSEFGHLRLGGDRTPSFTFYARLGDEVGSLLTKFFEQCFRLGDLVCDVLELLESDHATRLRNPVTKHKRARVSLTVADVEAQQLVLDGISLQMLEELVPAVRELDVEAPDIVALLADVTRAAVDPYAAAAELVAEQWYLESARPALAVPGPPPSVTTRVPDRGRYLALAGWSLTQPATVAALAGGAKRAALFGARQYLEAAPMLEQGKVVGVQRIARSGCCEFCTMLAARGPVYTSEEAASTVVGRGMELRAPGDRRRGGQPKGIRARGDAQLGGSYHDHCRCFPATVTRETEHAFAEQYDAAYATYYDAAATVSGRLQLLSSTTRAADGSLKNAYRWLDTETGRTVSGRNARTKLILAQMRRNAAA